MTEDQKAEARQGLDFYISYAGPDQAWAEWAGWQLTEAGYTVVLDVRDWLPGENIVLAREDALLRADRVLALCSTAYFGGGFTKQEWTAVMAAKHREPRRLIPVWIENLADEELPDLLRAVRPIKLFGIPAAEASQRLLADLAGDHGQDGTPLFPGPADLEEPRKDGGSGPRLPSAHWPAVWHVPPRNPDFTGRDSLLVQVREALQRASTGVVVLQGLSGVGKTQLTIEYAYRFAPDYDTVWVIDAEQPELITRQLADLSIAIGAVALAADAQTAVTAAISALQTRQRWLLVFDNVEEPSHIADFLPGGLGNVLVTARGGVWQEIGSLIGVKEFSRAESTALLTTRVATLPLTDADLLADALGDLPLALSQAAGVLQSMPASEFQRLLHSQATNLLSQATPRSYTTSLAAATLVAVDKLAAIDPKAAGLLFLCGYLAPEPIPATWFYHLADDDHPSSLGQISALPSGMWEVSQAYDLIRHVGLGSVDQKGLRLHRLTQAILRDHTADQQDAYRDLAVEVLTAAAPGDSEDPSSWQNWSQLIPHLLTATLGKAPDALRRLANAGALYLLVSGQSKAALAMTERLHTTWSAELGPDDPDALTAGQYLAQALTNSGNYLRALGLQQETLERRRRVQGEDHPDTLKTAGNLAGAFYSSGRRQEALVLMRDVYNRQRRVLGESHPDTQTTGRNLALILEGMGRRAEAVRIRSQIPRKRKKR